MTRMKAIQLMAVGSLSVRSLDAEKFSIEMIIWNATLVLILKWRHLPVPSRTVPLHQSISGTPFVTFVMFTSRNWLPKKGKNLLRQLTILSLIKINFSMFQLYFLFSFLAVFYKMLYPFTRTFWPDINRFWLINSGWMNFGICILVVVLEKYTVCTTHSFYTACQQVNHSVLSW